MKGRQLSIEERCARSLSRYKLKLDPQVIAMRYQEARGLMIEKMSKWMKVKVEIEKALKEIFEKYSIDRRDRIPYRNFAFALFKHLRNKSWPPDPRLSKALSSYYSILYEINEGILNEVALKVMELVKDSREKGILTEV